MPGWLNVVQILALCVLLIALSLIVLALRQRWLNRLGGNFECSLRLRVTTPGAGWVLETRDPDPVEAVALSSDQTVVRVQAPGRPGQVLELAMSAESLTGLLSWLESAPPGV